MGVGRVCFVVMMGLIAGGGAIGGCSRQVGPRVVSQDVSEFPHASGVVVSVMVETQEAVINVGSKDRVRPGMKFHVFDRRVPPRIGGLPFPSLNTEESVAELEVMEARERQSICRIVSTRQLTRVEPGALIANPVFLAMRSHRPKFVLIGGFDLNDDGVATAAERDRAARMISAYGGTVETELTGGTDYLVAGLRPASPVIPSPPVDDGRGTTPHQRQLEQARYDQVLQRASSELFVRILNTPRFLELVDPPTALLSDR